LKKNNFSLKLKYLKDFNDYKHFTNKSLKSKYLATKG
jgi:hypothetical protein